MLKKPHFKGSPNFSLALALKCNPSTFFLTLAKANVRKGKGSPYLPIPQIPPVPYILASSIVDATLWVSVARTPTVFSLHALSTVGGKGVHRRCCPSYISFAYVRKGMKREANVKDSVKVCGWVTKGTLTGSCTLHSGYMKTSCALHFFGCKTPANILLPRGCASHFCKGMGYYGSSHRQTGGHVAYAIAKKREFLVNSNVSLFQKPTKNSSILRQVVRVNKRESLYNTDYKEKDLDKDKVVSITYEEIGLFPRSFSRVLDRFLKQLFSDVDHLVIQEYRFYRYLFLTTIKTIFILLFVPFVVNFLAKNYLVKPITEYFWNTQQEIFLNKNLQKRAFAELQEFEEKVYFEALVQAKQGLGVKTKYTQLDENTKIQTQFLGLLQEQKIDYLKSANQKVEISLTENPDINLSFPFRMKREAFASHNPSFPQIPDIRFLPFGQHHRWKNVKDSVEVSGKGKNITQNPSVYISNKVTNVTPTVEEGGKGKSYISDAYVTQTKENKIFPYGESKALKNISIDIERQLQEKTVFAAIYYNNHSIEAITSFFADFLSLGALLYLFIKLEIQINITKSFLAEVFFGLDDSKKSLLILIVTDLLVGYHSSNLWELFFGFIFDHYGIPESQTGIFLLVATLPVLLDVLFKYLIFRHLNRSSPATVATYHAIIE